MSLTAVRPYFRTHLDSLSFKEWTDAFNVENIPSNLIDGSYHLQMLQGTLEKHNMTALEINQPLTVRLFRKGFRDPASAVDQVLTDSENILNLVLKPSNRLTGSLKNVSFSSLLIQESSDSNDNLVMLTLEFNVLVILNPN